MKIKLRRLMKTTGVFAVCGLVKRMAFSKISRFIKRDGVYVYVTWLMRSILESTSFLLV